jgi:hypothetical protein
MSEPPSERPEPAPEPDPGSQAQPESGAESETTAPQQPPPAPGQPPPYPPPPYAQPGQPPPYPPPPYGQPPYGPPAYPFVPYQPKPRHPQAITVMVLGCIALVGGLFTAGLATVAGPFAWWIGAKAKREIAAEPDRWSDEEMVTIGYILGIVATVFLALGILGIATIIVIAAAG